MALEFKLPDIGEGIAEGEIVKWHVAEGDAVEEHQTIVEVMTDKATVEVPAPRKGTITSILAEEGQVVPVGDVIFVLDEGGAAPAKPAKKEAAKPAAKPAPKPSPKAASAGSAKQPERPTAAAAKSSGTRTAASTPGPKAGAGRGATIEFKLPDVGEGIAEGEIVKWHVSAGDTVEEHQTVVEVMTDKANVDIPAPAAGTIGELRAAEGDVVPVGQVIFTLQRAGAAAGEAPPSREQEAEERTERPQAPRSDRGAQRAPDARSQSGEDGNGRVLAVPSARRVARELGVDLGEVAGSGRNGVVRRSDVEAFAREQKPGTAPAGTRTAAASTRPAFAPIALESGERETRVPFRGLRRKIAESMVRSKFTATHFTVVEELDVTELVDVRKEAKAIGAEQGVNVTYMPFIMKAVASGLARYPELNSKLDEEAQEIVTYGYVNLGIATDTDGGLIVPVVRDVQAKGLLQLASELNELAQRTREKKVQPDELRGGTFTITNAGNIGGILATPIINFPESAILGVHRIRKAPGVVETPEGDRIEVRQYMNLSVSVDHRLVDGASAVRFLVHVKRLLERPALLAL